MGGSTSAFLRQQLRRYPAMTVQDGCKALHQSVFGCGHFVSPQGMALLAQEWAQPTSQGIELLPGDFARLHLATAKAAGLRPETVFALFSRSADPPQGSREELEGRLAALQELAASGILPWDGEEAKAHIDAWRASGFPACHHSPAFREAYAPAYRVIRRSFLWCLPLLAAIDRAMEEKARVVVALEGGSAAGKTTLSALLEELYGCTVFHMDDFFLQPHQRTEERLSTPGGNVDYERFSQEVLSPLTRGETVSYRPWNCQTQSLGEVRTVVPKALTVVEGAYSMHPALEKAYDLSAFLSIGEEQRRERIGRRNTPEFAQRFFDLWIPLEQRYFAATDLPRRCHLTLTVGSEPTVL